MSACLVRVVTLAVRLQRRQRHRVSLDRDGGLGPGQLVHVGGAGGGSGRGPVGRVGELLVVDEQHILNGVLAGLWGGGAGAGAGRGEEML